MTFNLTLPPLLLDGEKQFVKKCLLTFDIGKEFFFFFSERNFAVGLSRKENSTYSNAFLQPSLQNEMPQERSDCLFSWIGQD